ncbi:MAG: alpha/beta hydrolase [Ruminococcaceae bacterium]|nr:alpha/beta hydrolase [Oscillospiraceae bacterium]
MKKSRKILIGASCVALAAAIGMAGWRIAVREASKQHNLITLDTSDVPSPITEFTEHDIQLSEVKMHYAVYGDRGYPLILIHGNAGDKNSLAEAASYLANDYKVYVPESRCHGQSSDPGAISYDLMAKDIKEFCEALGIEKPYIMGHSDGGINALTLAYTYPDLPGAIISCGANSVPEKFKPYFTVGVKVMNLFKPDKLNDMMLTLPQMNAELLSRITCPTYIVAGENDIMWLSDTVFLYESTQPYSDIAVIKGANHSSYISQDGKQAYALAKSYFEGL